MYEANSFDDKFITREELLLKVTQIEIMERYLGIPVQFNKSVKNPLRKDNSAGCRFYVKNGRVRFVDYSKGFNEDCFGVVQYQYNCNFNDAIKTIAKDFKIYDVVDYKPNEARQIEEQELEEAVPHTYLYELFIDGNGTTNWQKPHKEYWKNHCLNSEILLELDIYPLKNLYMDNRLIYTYRLNDPAYLFKFPDGTFKAYFPLRSKEQIKFITNSKYLQGYNHIPEQGEILVITKAMKDIACFKLFNIPAVAPQSENTFIDEDLLDDLEDRFELIVTLFDFDLTGVRAANRLYKQRGFEPLFLTTGKFNTKGYRAKDFSQYLLNNKRDKTLKLIQEVYNEII